MSDSSKYTIFKEWLLNHIEQREKNARNNYQTFKDRYYNGCIDEMIFFGAQVKAAIETIEEQSND